MYVCKCFYILVFFNKRRKVRGKKKEIYLEMNEKDIKVDLRCYYVCLYIDKH